MTCSVSLPPLLLAATAIPALAATEVALTDDPTCEQWGTEAFFSAADATITARCLETRDPNEVAEDGAPVLFSAASHSDSGEVVRLLIEAGADVNARLENGRTPLHAAARDNASVDALRVLLANGSDADALDEQGFAPLHMAACCNENAAVVAALLHAGADVEVAVNGATPLLYAASNNPDVLELLLASGADADVRWFIGGGTLLHRTAAFNANADALRVVLYNGGDVKARDDDGNTPLHEAATFNENAAIVEALVASRADISARNDDGNTPLHAAASSNENAAIVEALVASKADISAANENGETPLYRAVRYNNNEAIKALIALGADVNVTDKDGDSALLRAVHFNSGAAQLLLEAGADPSFRGQDGHAALYEALAHGEESNVAFLLRHGADPNAPASGVADLNTRTPLHWAVSLAEDPATVGVLLAAGGNVEARDNFGKTPLHDVRDLPVLEQLLRAGARIDARTPSGETVLHTAAEGNRSAPVIQGLLATGARLEARDQRGRTPLHAAANDSGNGLSIRALVAAGANIEARDEAGNTPLLLAAQDQDTIDVFQHAAKRLAEDEMTQDQYEYIVATLHAADAVTALLEAGADPMARNAEGQTPWDLAQENEPLKTTEAYWQLNEARFAAPTARRTGTNQIEPRPQTTSVRPTMRSRTCEIPGYPSPGNVENLGLSWCTSNVGFQRRAFALQAAGAWCAVAGGSSSSADQLAARHREINAACDRLDAMQSPGTPTCRCPTGYRP